MREPRATRRQLLLARLMVLAAGGMVGAGLLRSRRADAGPKGDDRRRLGARALRTVRAKDETLHMTFYRDVVKAHLDLDPDYLRPLAAVMFRFEVPWSGAIVTALSLCRCAPRGECRADPPRNPTLVRCRPTYRWAGEEGRAR